MGHIEHEKLAEKQLKIGVLTLSDTRDEKSDKSGLIIRKLLIREGHSIVKYAVVREDPDVIRENLESWLSSDLDAIITNGGTGLTARDGTVEVARKLFEKELDGFGELFRLLSFHQIGPAAMLSRATAGLAHGKILICLPGSSKGVNLAVERIILPQLSHMVWEANR
jgi:molybdenum cofactor biosynthesis protein B